MFFVDLEFEGRKKIKGNPFSSERVNTCTCKVNLL